MSRLDKIRGFLGFGLVSRITLQEAIVITTHLRDEPQHSPAGRGNGARLQSLRGLRQRARCLRGPRTGPRFVSCAFCVPLLVFSLSPSSPSLGATVVARIFSVAVL